MAYKKIERGYQRKGGEHTNVRFDKKLERRKAKKGLKKEIKNES